MLSLVMLIVAGRNILLDGIPTQIAKFMGPTWGPPGSCRPQMGPMFASWTLLSGNILPLNIKKFIRTHMFPYKQWL